MATQMHVTANRRAVCAHRKSSRCRDQRGIRVGGSKLALLRNGNRHDRWQADDERRNATQQQCRGTAVGKDGFPLEEDFPLKKRQVAPLLYVSQVMNTDVVYLNEEDTLRDALELFLEQRVSGAPVVNGDGELRGVLSMTDIIWVESKEAMSTLEFPFYPNLGWSDEVNVDK